MRNSPIVRKLLVLLAASSLLGAAFIVASPAVIGLVANPPCTSVHVATSVGQFLERPAAITLLASSTGCNQPAEYQFYLQAPGGAWIAQGPFSTTDTFIWNSSAAALGNWGIGARARAAGSKVAYDAYYLGTFNLHVHRCIWVRTTVAPSEPQVPGTAILFFAQTSYCSSPDLRFLALPPGGSTWITLRGYAPATATFAWDTTGLAPGTWQIGVWARQHGSHAAYEAYSVVSYALSRGDPCRYVDLNPNLASPQAAGASVVFSSSSCLPRETEFWRMAPGGVWAIVQAYSTDENFTWDTTGFAAGRYQIGVWVRQIGSAHSYETYSTITYYIGT